MADFQEPEVEPQAQPDNNIDDLELQDITDNDVSIDSNSQNAPIDPIMGKFIEQNPLGCNKWNARMGGKPNTTWTGLDEEQNVKSTPFHYRRPEMTDDVKGFKIRSTGLSTKFKQNDDLLQFQQHVWKHLTGHGLDTITYLRDPLDSSKVLSVVMSHAMFSADIKTTKKSADYFAERFDDFDRSNDEAAKLFLLDSLEPKLALLLERKVKDDDGFVLVWLRLVQLVVAPSLDRWDILKNKFRSASLKGYTGQDVRRLCNDLEDWAITLRAGGQYDHSLTRTMIKTVLESDDLPSVYRFKLSQLQLEVDEALSSSIYMSPAERWVYMEEKELTFEDVCDQMETAYDSLVINDEWPAAKLKTDSASVPAKYANIHRHLQTLLQNDTSHSNGKKKKKVTCYNCGGDHYARECPLLKNKSATKPKSWKLIPPGKGDALTKKVKENTFNWCSKCKRWTTTHTTATHVGKSVSKDESKEHTASLLEMDPSAWCLCGNVCDPLLTRAETLANVIGIQLDPQGTVVDHVCTLEEAVWEETHDEAGTLDERLSVLEYELDDMDDVAMFEGFHREDEHGRAWLLSPFRQLNANHLSADGTPPPKRAARLRNVTYPAMKRPSSKRPKTSHKTDDIPYKFLTYLYLFLAFVFLVAPVQHMASEVFFEFGSSSLDVIKIIGLSTLDIFKAFGSLASDMHSHFCQHLHDIYLPVLAPIFWILAGYFACCLSRPKPVTTLDIISSYIPRHLRRETKGTRRKQRKLNKGNKKCSSGYRKQEHKIDVSGLGKFIRQQPRTNKARRKCKEPGTTAKRKAMKLRCGRHQARSSSDPVFHCPRFTTDRRQMYNDYLVNMLGPRDISGLSKHLAMRAALHAPQRFREAMGKSDQFPIIWDSGASACVTFDKKDFLSVDTSKRHKPLKSVAGDHSVHGEGFVLWSIPDETGVLRHFKLKALWVPDCTVRLRSAASLLQQYKGESVKLSSSELHLSGSKSDRSRNPRLSLYQSPDISCISLQWV